ncbi:hypothetical protein M0802_007523 [Mischocyttarus mexicanus]|nr:hypothetical protein M0802_007523 [Mischocyttarus mexicanus]
MNSAKISLRSICKLLFKKTSSIVCLSPLIHNPSSKEDTEIKEDTTKLNLPDVKTLTYNYMIKQSTLKAINNASDLITTTFLAIETLSEEYRSSLLQLINLDKNYLESNMNESPSDDIVQIRLEVENKKNALMQLLMFMESIRKMADSTTEICYLYGMNNLCSSLSQRVEDAFKNIKKELYNNEKLLREFKYIEQQNMINDGKL